MLERFSHKCIPHKWNLVAKFKPLLDAYGRPYKDKGTYNDGGPYKVSVSGQE